MPEADSVPGFDNVSSLSLFPSSKADNLLDRILELLRELLPLDTCLLVLRQDKELVVGASFGFPPALFPAGRKLDPESFPLEAEITATARSLIVEDVSRDPRFNQGPDPAPSGSRMGIALAVPGFLPGMLSLASHRSGQYGAAECRLAETFAEMAALALRSEALFATAQRRIEELDAVNKVSKAVSSRLGVEELCEAVGEYLADIFQVGTVYVALLEEAAARIDLVFYSHDGVREIRDSFPFDSGLTAEVLKTKAPLCVGRGLGTIARIMGARALPGRAARSWLGVPIIYGDQALGVLSVQSSDREDAFSAEDQRLLSTIASTVGAGIRNARLYASERRRAEEAASLAQAAGAAKAEAEAANRSKTRFLANMTHELRTPLNAIINLAYLIQEGGEAPSAEIADAAARIESSGRHLLGLINDVLDLSKIEAGQMDIRISPTDFTEVAASVLQSVPALGLKDGVQLRNQLPAKLPPVLADPLRLRQVLFDLVGNAVKFTDRGFIALRAHPAEDRLEIEIEDTGIGMDEADLPKALSDFVQLDDDLDRRARGSGLGLPIARRLVELQGGRLWAHSCRGMGSTFGFSLPLAEKEGRASPPPPSKEDQDARPQA